LGDGAELRGEIRMGQKESHEKREP
jgi:hypothetical protein